MKEAREAPSSASSSTTKKRGAPPRFLTWPGSRWPWSVSTTFTRRLVGCASAASGPVRDVGGDRGGSPKPNTADGGVSETDATLAPARAHRREPSNRYTSETNRACVGVILKPFLVAILESGNEVSQPVIDLVSTSRVRCGVTAFIRSHSKTSLFSELVSIISLNNHGTSLLMMCGTHRRGRRGPSVTSRRVLEFEFLASNLGLIVRPCDLSRRDIASYDCMSDVRCARGWHGANELSILI